MSMSEQVRQMNERMDRIHQEIRDDARRRGLSTLDGSSSPEAVMDPNPFITEVSQNEQQDQMSKKLEELHKELESKVEVKEVPKPINEEPVIQPPKPLNMDNFNTTIELDSSVSKAVGSGSATPAGSQSPSR
jgi:hypothetical protein